MNYAEPPLISPPSTAQRLADAIDHARRALLARQQPDGHWCFELEADCTIPAEYILMMHYMDEIDAGLQERLARYLRAKQEAGDGWAQYHGGAMDLSGSIKAYYALKLAGDSADAPHMQRARRAILAAGGAAKGNVFTRIALAQFGQLPWRGVPFLPVEIVLFPRWFPICLEKVSCWSRAVMVPLTMLCTAKPQARNPSGIGIAELFVTPPDEERDYFVKTGFINRAFLALDWIGRRAEPLIPPAIRRRAMKKAESWFIERLNGDSGLGAIFPAMVNAYEAMDMLGYPPGHPDRAICLKAIQRLLVERPDGSAYCQPCLSPVWDTAWSAVALMTAGGDGSEDAVQKVVDWLLPRQILHLKGDWSVQVPELAPGGWAFQYANDYYPDTDDTAVVVALFERLDRKRPDPRLREAMRRAADWLVGMQSEGGAFAAFDVNNTHHYLNLIPFADHGALLDPPTEDVTARVVLALGLLGRESDQPALAAAIAYLQRVQQADGSWWGRWGTNYLYGTWSVLGALGLAGQDMSQPWIRKAVNWLETKQNADGGWGETNDTYLDPSLAGSFGGLSTPYSTAWALLGLMAAGEVHGDAVARGAAWLLAQQHKGDEHDGLWDHPSYTAPGFPRMFYLRYHGYNAYFPLWALARYRQLTAH